MAVTEGRLPPQDLDAERSALGAMMLSEVAVSEIVERLRADDFYRTGHAEIFRAIHDLAIRSEPVDQLTVCDALAARGTLEEVGGRSEVYALTEAVPVAANAVRYADIVRENALLRGLIRAGEQIARLGFERQGEAADLLDEAERIMHALARHDGAQDFAAIRELLEETFNQIAAMHARGDGSGITGVATGFRDLDALTAGLQASNLVILAARPSMGKTSLALNIAEHVAVKLRRPVALFSLEMSKGEIAQRLMCSVGNVDTSKLRRGELSDGEWASVTGAVDTLTGAPLFIDDTGGLTVMEMRSKARRLSAREPGGLALIVVDYIQLMSSPSSAENRVQEVSQISRALKVLARELDVPVIALSQLSRAVEQRTDKRPVLSDLRESGSIEQDADVVAFIYREAYYKRGEDGQEVMAPDDPDRDLTEVILAKHRNGPVGSIKLRFQPRFTRFRDDYGAGRSGGGGGPAVIQVRVATHERCVLVDVTEEVQRAVEEEGIDGAVLLHVPHTTAAVTVNEGYDPDVAGDLLRRLEALAPHLRDTEGQRDRHTEGNSDSHLKAALVGGTVLLPVVGGQLALGRWQRVFFCEFDGPRRRELWVSSPAPGSVEPHL